MVWALEQSTSQVLTAIPNSDFSVSLGATPTAGRLLVMVVGMRSATDGTLDPSASTLGGTITGWTQVTDQQAGDLGLGIWVKLAASSEGTTVTLDQPGTTAKGSLWLGEFSGNAANATPDDSDAQSVTAALVSLGPVASVTAGSLAIAAVCAQGNVSDIVWESLTEQFQADSTADSGSRTYTGVAWGQLTGSITEDASWTGTVPAAGAVLVFEPAAPPLLERSPSESLALSDSVSYTIGESATSRTITDTLTITDSGSLVAGEPGTDEIVAISDTVTWRITRPTEPTPITEQVATKADWAVYAVHRVPAASGFPSFTEVGEVPFTTLTWNRRLNQPDQIVLSVPLASLNATVRAGLKKPWETPLELWVFRLSEPMAAGPIWPGTIQGGTVTVNAGGVLDYLRGMAGTSTELSYFDVDQAAIVKALVDHYQAKSFGHYGIATNGVVLSGVNRTRNYPAAEPSDVFSLVQNLTRVANGPDVDIELSLEGTQMRRSLAVYYPQKGRDLASAVVLDANVISNADVVFGVGPQDIASVAVVYGGGQNLPPVRAEATSSDLLGSWGRWGATETAPDVINAATVADHAAELLASRSGRLYLPGPNLRSTAEVNPASIGTGDAVTYDYDDGLGRDLLVGRLVEIETTVDAAGERMRVQLS